MSITKPDVNEGEIYVGAIISADESRNHHIILLPGDMDELSWEDANEWAKSIGGKLPDRIEGALLFATQKAAFKKDWYWTREQHASDSVYAWYQNFHGGNQRYNRKSYELRARAVRRLVIE